MTIAAQNEPTEAGSAGRKSGAFWAPLLALSLVPYLILSVFARPLADDYCSSALFSSLGFWNAQVNAFFSWTNRYATMLFIGIFDWFGLWGLRVLPVFLILGLTFSSYLLLKRFSRHAELALPRLSLLAASLALTLLTLSALPNLYQSIYWRAGSIAYTLPVIALNCLLAGLLKAREGKPAGYLPVVFGLAAFVASGFSTINAAAQFTALGIVFCVLARRGRQASAERGLWIGALAGSLLGLVLLALQPGARLRLEQMPPMPGLGRLIYLTLRHSAALVYHSLRDYLPARMAALLLGVLLGLSGRALAFPSFKKLLTPLLLSALALFLLTAAFCAPSALIQSAYPEERAQTGAVFLFSAALLAAGFFVGGWLRARQPGFLSHAPLILLNIGALVCLFLAQSQLPAQFSTFRKHAAAWDKREAVILTQKDAGARSLLVPGVDSLAGLMELTPDPSNWVNECAASYYQLDSIRSTE